MFKKRDFLFLVCVIILHSNLSSCLQPRLDDPEQESLSAASETLDIFPEYSENIVIKSIFISNEDLDQDRILDEEEYSDNLKRLEEMLNKKEENFLNTYVKKHNKKPESEDNKDKESGDYFSEDKEPSTTASPLNYDEKPLSNSEFTTILLIILSITITCLFVLIVAIYVIKQRAHLTEGGNFVVHKKGLDDEENLVAGECDSAKRTWRKFVPFLGKPNGNQNDSTPNQDYKELCRQRMQSNKISPITSTLCTARSDANDTTTTPGNLSLGAGNPSSNTINSTPIKITGDANQSRNSSW